MNSNYHSTLIVEDIRNTRLRFERIIDKSDSFYLTGSTDTVSEGMKLLLQKKPDILLVDLGLPDGDGNELIKFISNQSLDTLAMVITVFGDEKHVVPALESGATGYILKDEEHQDIIQSMQQMISGGSPISPVIARHMLKRFHTENKIAPIHSPTIEKLTYREQEVLLMVSKGYTSNEIAEMMSVSYYTITTHVRNIYGKLSVNSRAEAVIEALQLGIITSSTAS